MNTDELAMKILTLLRDTGGDISIGKDRSGNPVLSVDYGSQSIWFTSDQTSLKSALANWDCEVNGETQTAIMLNTSN